MGRTRADGSFHTSAVMDVCLSSRESQEKHLHLTEQGNFGAGHWDCGQEPWGRGKAWTHDHLEDKKESQLKLLFLLALLSWVL